MEIFAAGIEICANLKNRSIPAPHFVHLFGERVADLLLHAIAFDGNRRPPGARTAESRALQLPRSRLARVEADKRARGLPSIL